MAILETKKNIKEKAMKSKPDKAVVAEKINKEKLVSSSGSYGSLISRPRITEKSSDASHRLNAYTFEIRKNVSKGEVANAVKELYKVNPLKVNVINLPRKRTVSRGKKGWSGGVKKAVVYLKKDDKIEFI